MKYAPSWAILTAGIIAATILVRTFLISSFYIYTTSMDNALQKGDYILVSKWLPGKNSIKLNDIILFKSPLPSDGRPPILLSRCVALPGDTVKVHDDGYTINGLQYPRSPDALTAYSIPGSIKKRFFDILEKLDIPRRETTETESSLIHLRLTPFEEYRIREELTPAMNAAFIRPRHRPYTIIIPRKNVEYHLDERFLAAAREAIRQETNGQAVFRNGKLYINEKKTDTFRFDRDYYWALSDNIDQAIDSRHVGFIPRSGIIGKACFRLHSSAGRSFKAL